MRIVFKELLLLVDNYEEHLFLAKLVFLIPRLLMDCLQCGRDIGSDIGKCKLCYREKRQLQADLHFKKENKFPTFNFAYCSVCIIASAFFIIALFTGYQQSTEVAKLLSQTEEVAPGEPMQKAFPKKTWRHNDFKITALSSYSIRAQVILRETFSFSLWREASISPLDLTLAWGLMSSAKNRQGISFSHSGRFYYWRTSGVPPIDPGVLNRHVANVHIIPASKKLRTQLLKVGIGEVVNLTGFLIKAEHSDGWSWESSMSRDDSGAHACELFWVAEVSQ